MPCSHRWEMWNVILRKCITLLSKRPVRTQTMLVGIKIMSHLTHTESACIFNKWFLYREKKSQKSLFRRPCKKMALIAHCFCADSKWSRKLNYGYQVIWFVNRGHFQCSEILIRPVHVTCWIMNALGSEIDMKIGLISISDPLWAAIQISSLLTKVCSRDTDRHDLWVHFLFLVLIKIFILFVWFNQLPKNTKYNYGHLSI